MSFSNLSALGRYSRNKCNNVLLHIRTFSRKTNNDNGPYKFVTSKRAANENILAAADPNFELLASPGEFPFFLPGNVGMGWYNTQTTLQPTADFTMEEIEDRMEIDGHVICRVQTCPTVLRKTACDLFPYRNLETSELSIVTISLKPNMRSLRQNREIEIERLAQTFVITAKCVCDKLRKAGYWADFINPFSGRPYQYPTFGNPLYEADEKFRCLDFQIIDLQDCKIISNEQHDTSKRRFIGSLFTNAPSKKNHLNNIFTK